MAVCEKCKKNTSVTKRVHIFLVCPKCYAELVRKGAIMR